MGIGMLFFWIIPIGLIAALVVYLLNQGGVAKRSESAVETLEKAYARGDISREEFLQKRMICLRKRNYRPSNNSSLQVTKVAANIL